MAYLGSWKIDDLLTFPANTHTASTGAATDADAVPDYRVYEDETGTAILTGSMAKLDDTNTTGFYSEQLTLSAANGFEKGKCYTVYISAAVASVTGTMAHTFQIEAEINSGTVSGTSDSGTTTTMVDAARTEADTDYWKGSWIHFTSGTISGQTRLITGFTPASDTITFAPATTQAVSTQTYEILPNAAVDIGAISTDSTAADNAEAFFDGTGYAGTNNVMPTTTTVTNTVNANAIQISGDSVAADNAEAFFDGTGYAGTGNTIPTVTAVTNGVNVSQISGDATAADNAEAFFDGTGYAGTGNTIPTVTAVTNAVTTTERRVQGSLGINASNLLVAHAWLTDPDGTIVNATAATFEVLDYDGTSIVGTAAWTTAPTETAANTWYADKTSVTLVEGMAYRLRVVITAGSAYTRDIPFTAVA